MDGRSGRTYRLTRREVLRLTAGGAVAAGLAAACQPTATPVPGASAAASDAPKFGGTAVINAGQEPDTLLFYAAGTSYAGNIRDATANGLTKIALPDLNAVPDLAESWTISPDGKTYTFKVRKGVKWHDGQPMTLQDIKFTYEVLANPARAGALSAALAGIVGASAFKKKEAKEISGLTLIGDDTIRFQLEDVSALFLVQAANAVILPQHILKDVPVADLPKHPFARKPIGTGPFQVSEWKQGEGVVVKAFPEHFAGRPRLDSIIYRGFPEAATALAELRGGGVVLHFVGADQFAEFEKDPNYTTQRLPGTTAWYWQYDLLNPLFKDVKVRQAISYAIDRKTVIDGLFRGAGDPNYTLVSPLSWIYNPNTSRAEYDAAKAKQLLEDAGWKTGADGIRVKDGQRFEYKIMCSPRTSPWAVALQPYTKAVGINMQIEQLEFASILAKSKPGTYAAVFQGWGNFSGDPRNDLTASFQSEPLRANDYTGYRNAKVDQLFTEGARTTDDAQVKKIYGQVQEIVEGEFPSTHLWRIQDLLVVRNTLKIPKLKLGNELWKTVAQWEMR